MAKRQESGSNAAQQNERPAPHEDEAMPELTDDVRGRADEVDDEFDDADDLDEADDEEDDDEGTF